MQISLSKKKKKRKMQIKNKSNSEVASHTIFFFKILIYTSLWARVHARVQMLFYFLGKFEITTFLNHKKEKNLGVW